MEKEYECLRRLRHNGKTYPAYARLDLEWNDAESLMRRGAIRSMDDDAGDAGDAAPNYSADPGANPSLSDIEEQPAKIVAAIGQLGEGDFTASAAPKTDALTRLVGFSVSGAERDRAWAIVEAVIETPAEELLLADIAVSSKIADVSEAEFAAALALRQKKEGDA